MRSSNFWLFKSHFNVKNPLEYGIKFHVITKFTFIKWFIITDNFIYDSGCIPMLYKLSKNVLDEKRMATRTMCSYFVLFCKGKFALPSNLSLE